MNECTFIIFGFTGALSRSKLLPALYQLTRDKKMTSFAIIGAGLDDDITAMLEEHKNLLSYDNQVWQEFSAHIYYQKADFNNANDMQKIKQLLDVVERKHNLNGTRLIYMACPSEFFCPLTQTLIDTHIALSANQLSNNIWHRIVYEKPFGADVASAHEINQCVALGLEEKQIFRIDHYLAKELVSNIALVRFTNCIFEPLWNNQHIEHVQIILAEQELVEHRTAYYDRYGALKDVVQNHMLQMLALIAMESPEKLTGNYIRDKKVEVLKEAYPVDGLLGQYQSYRKHAGIAPDSTTDTFAILQMHIDNARWKGVPFYLKTGKALNKKETIIYIRFKMVDCLLAHECPSEPNTLIIRLYPETEFILQINTKKPGAFQEVMPISMSFGQDLYTPATIDAYEKLLDAVMQGDQSISVRFDEIEYAWRIIDGVEKMQLPSYSYTPGTTGPEQSNVYAQKHAMRWYI